MVSWYLCSWVWYTSLCACNATFSYWMGCIWLSQSCSAASFSLMAEANFQTSRGNTVATTHSINGLRYMPFNCASAIIVFNIPNRFWHIYAHKTFSQIWNITSSFWLKKVFLYLNNRCKTHFACEEGVNIWFHSSLHFLWKSRHSLNADVLSSADLTCL